MKLDDYHKAINVKGAAGTVVACLPLSMPSAP